MARPEVIAMAREAELPEAWISQTGVLKWADLERFAALVAAREREACAAKIEAITYRRRWASASINGTPLAPCELATAIRAIGTP